MTGVILLFLLGLVLMVKGGDSFVEGAEWMARVTGIPPFVVAATVVSLGTTMPELHSPSPLSVEAPLLLYPPASSHPPNHAP